MDTMYESKLTARRWIAYDLPGNIGWIVWIVCLILMLTQGVMQKSSRMLSSGFPIAIGRLKLFFPIHAHRSMYR